MRSSFGRILPAVFILYWIGNLFVVLPVCSKPLATATSASATATATVAVASCTDDKTLRFRVKGKTKEKTCKWVANKPQNRCKTKQSNGKKQKLKYLCREACNNCKKTTPGVVSCTDDKTRQFRVGGKTRKCNWVAKKPNNRCHKIQTDGKQRQLKRLCRAACHNCKTATQNPTRAPTNTPTKEPPTTTTTMMTKPPTNGPTTSSHVSNTVTIINKTPIIKQGATLYDKIDQASISIFGTPSCPSSGCVVQGGETFHVENMGAGTGTDADLTYFLLGLQWNIARMASSDYGLCDNACRQIRVDWTTCTFVQYETSGTCYTNAAGIENYTPRWYPDIDMVQQATTTTSTGNNNTTTTTTCILTVTQNSVMEIDGTTGQEPDTCGCAYGAYPCICGPTPDDTCVGQCSGDINNNSQCNPFEAANSKPDECCFCEGKTGSNTCSATDTVTATTRPSNVPTQSPTESPRIVNQDPHPCGCATCTEDVLNTYAGEHKCRDRIQYLRYEQGFTEANACARVGGIEFPTMNNGCGRCDPNRCSLDDNEDDEDDSEEDDEDTNDDEEPLPPRPFNTNNKCGGAVNFSNEDSNLVCQQDLWEPTDDTTMHCFAYGGRGDPCHLSNNNDVNDGLTKDPSLCTTGDTFYLWDEPDTQGKSYTWAGQAWYEYSRRFATELQHIRDAFGIKVTSPLLKAGSEGVLGGNINAFFDACGPACFDVHDPAYIDIIAINAFCGDFNGPAGCRGGAEFITKEATQLYQQYSLPIYITNWSKLGTSHPDDQLEAMDAIDEFFIPQRDDTNQDDGIIERVFWFGATDYGGGSSNNFLTTELSNGVTLGDYWYDKCNTL